MFPKTSTLVQPTTMVVTISMEYLLTLLHHIETFVLFLMTSLNFISTRLKLPFSKANRILGLIKRSFEYLDSTQYRCTLVDLSWNTKILLGDLVIFSTREGTTKGYSSPSTISYAELTVILPPTLLIYIHTQDLLSGGISLNCLRNTPDYCGDQITLLIKSRMIGIVYQIMLQIVLL